eukprot:6645068-Pyramimonas_sp.AAC.1
MPDWSATTRRAISSFRGKARQLKLAAEKWYRNLGHDAFSVRSVRKQAQVRLDKLRDRLLQLPTLGRAPAGQ